MEIEVIIATRNRRNDLLKTLDSISQQIERPSKIIVVDSSDDELDQSPIKRKFEQIKVDFKIIRSLPGLTYQRNVGLGQIEKDIIVFLDDDVLLEKDYFKKIKMVFENNGRIGGATGKIKNAIYKPSLLSKIIRKMFFMAYPGRGEVLPSGCGCYINYTLDTSFPVQWLSGCNMAYRKEVFNELSFDENLAVYACEDLDFSYRVSKRFDMVYVPDAALDHCLTPASRLSQKIRSGMYIRGHHYLFRKNIEQKFYNKFCHYLSLHGILIQKLILERSLGSFWEVLKGYFEIIFMHNYKMPDPKVITNPKFK